MQSHFVYDDVHIQFANVQLCVFGIKAHPICNLSSISLRETDNNCKMSDREEQDSGAAKKIKINETKRQGLFESIRRGVNTSNPSVPAARTNVHIHFASRWSIRTD